MLIKQFQDLIEQVKQLPFRQERETNIFSIGARGHYENPVSDLLAFFIDPNATHGMGDVALQALWNCILDEKQKTADTSLIRAPERECVTHDGNRIDLLLESKNWVMLIENKIYHHINNPFESYKTWAEREFKDQQVICLVLSIQGEKPEHWLGVSWSQYLRELKAVLAESFSSSTLSKWHVLFREYILHLEALVSPTKYTEKEERFIFDSLDKIKEINELKQNVIKAFQEEIQAELASYFSSEVAMAIHDWSGFPALRFSLTEWKTKSDLVLYLDAKDGENFHINVHAHTADKEAAEEIAEEIMQSKGQWREINNTFMGFRLKMTTLDKASLITEVVENIKLLEIYDQQCYKIITNKF